MKKWFLSYEDLNKQEVTNFWKVYTNGVYDEFSGREFETEVSVADLGRIYIFKRRSMQQDILEEVEMLMTWLTS